MDGSNYTLESMKLFRKDSIEAAIIATVRASFHRIQGVFIGVHRGIVFEKTKRGVVVEHWPTVATIDEVKLQAIPDFSVCTRGHAPRAVVFRTIDKVVKYRITGVDMTNGCCWHVALVSIRDVSPRLVMCQAAGLVHRSQRWRPSLKMVASNVNFSLFRDAPGINNAVAEDLLRGIQKLQCKADAELFK